jgi:hypothetical protein
VKVFDEPRAAAHWNVENAFSSGCWLYSRPAQDLFDSSVIPGHGPAVFDRGERQRSEA